MVVEVSTDDGRTWAPAGATSPLSENAEVSVSDENIELARITRARAYVLTFASQTGTSETAGSLSYTADGGRDLGARARPVPAVFRFRRADRGVRGPMTCG